MNNIRFYFLPRPKGQKLEVYSVFKMQQSFIKRKETQTYENPLLEGMADRRIDILYSSECIDVKMMIICVLYDIQWYGSYLYEIFLPAKDNVDEKTK